eukprot:TRINITY_DN6626_c0_g1_i2.p1 TRINITY_DN6626_c0_g1~~TRINITY_DN6626_c0_g1_i2.p1  ORF type:complete len:157 (+),score=26.67 TRINITY_DN6626_c0_g1_i2:478-948(+)
MELLSSSTAENCAYPPEVIHAMGDLFLRQIERKMKIERYKTKRQNRQNQIRYHRRQKLAEDRIRFKGRFISKQEIERLKNQYGKDIIKQGDRVAELDTALLPYEEILIHTPWNVKRTQKGIQKVIERYRKLENIKQKFIQLTSKLSSRSPVFSIRH